MINLMKAYLKSGFWGQGVKEHSEFSRIGIAGGLHRSLEELGHHLAYIAAKAAKAGVRWMGVEFHHDLDLEPFSNGSLPFFEVHVKWKRSIQLPNGVVENMPNVEVVVFGDAQMLFDNSESSESIMDMVFSSFKKSVETPCAFEHVVGYCGTVRWVPGDFDPEEDDPASIIEALDVGVPFEDVFATCDISNFSL